MRHCYHQAKSVCFTDEQGNGLLGPMGLRMDEGLIDWLADGLTQYLSLRYEYTPPCDH